MERANKRRRLQEPTDPGDDGSMQVATLDDSTSGGPSGSKLGSQDPSEEGEEEQEEESIPEPKFRVFQKIFARDHDGLVYEAVVRRIMYGTQYQKQVPVGMSLTQQEIMEKMEQYSTALEPTYHYFVHYNGWNPNFDRFVAEEDCFDVTDTSVKAYAARVKQEHTALRKSMMRPSKGKKTHQTVNGAEFLRAWRKKLDQINLDSRVGPSSVANSASDEKQPAESQDANSKVTTTSRKTKESETWTLAAVEKEIALRKKGLTQKRLQAEASMIALPFSLKKVLVEQWEIICQCGMVSSLPATVSIRDALNRYLESKGVSVLSHEKSKCDTETAEPMDTAEVNSTTESQKMEDAHAKDIQQEVSEDKTSASSDEKVESVKSSGPTETPFKDSVKVDAKSRADQEWIDMAAGITQLFDEALPSRLLYEEEIPQIQVLDSLPELTEKHYSDFFGCEHLLRLFVRLPPLLAEGLPEEETRPIVAKVNDFIRFIFKNQSTLLSLTYRKMNEAELKVKQKMLKNAERKRKNMEPLTNANSQVMVKLED